jgi:ureidoglycolate lyase
VTLTKHPVFTDTITPEAFEPYGQILTVRPNGATTDLAEQALDLSAGTPRFYLIEIERDLSTFTRITRHRQVTQVLAAVGGGNWWMAVSLGEGQAKDAPRLDDIVGFEIPGDVGLLLHRGTWHAGPFFPGPSKSFFNLELTDTNTVDHDTSDLADRYGVECWFDHGSEQSSASTP